MSARCAGQASASTSIPTSLTSRVLRTRGEGRGVARVRAIHSRRVEASTSPDSIAIHACPDRYRRGAATAGPQPCTQLQADRASSVDRRGRGTISLRFSARKSATVLPSAGGRDIPQRLSRPGLPLAPVGHDSAQATPESASTAEPARKAKRTPQRRAANAQRKHWSLPEHPVSRSPSLPTA